MLTVETADVDPEGNETIWFGGKVMEFPLVPPDPHKYKCRVTGGGLDHVFTINFRNEASCWRSIPLKLLTTLLFVGCWQHNFRGIQLQTQ